MISRRRPVPREWRERHHWLDVRSRVVGRAPVVGNVYRASGRCTCGAVFGGRAGDHTVDRAAVIEEWKDHVEEAYYAEREG